MQPNQIDERLTTKELQSAKAKHFAEMKLLQTDLNISARLLKLWMGRRDITEPDDIIINNALFRDAIVQFVACFGNSKYQLKPTDVFGHIDGGIRYFRWLKDIRDSYVAHRFGPLRQTIPIAILTPDNELLGINTLTALYLGPTKGEDSQLPIFFEVACEHINNLVNDLGKDLFSSTKKLGVKGLLELPDAKLEHASPDQIRMSRENFRNRKSRRRARQKRQRGQGE